MRPIGFSTGAVARGDVAAGVATITACDGADAIELSALRLDELEPLIEALPKLRLDVFRHVSVHAPSRFGIDDEDRVVSLLSSLPREWPIVLHPDSVHRIERWSPLAARILIENMDTRKSTGRTAAELQPFFAALPEARFCLDIAHARDVSGDRSEIERLLHAYGERLVQLHVSSIGSGGEHGPLDASADEEHEGLSVRLHESVALVIESVLDGDEIPRELRRVRRLFGGG